MSKYLRSSFFDTEFDGDRVRAFIKPLRQEDGLRVRSLNTSADKDAERSKLASDLVLAYVEKIEGLVTGDGSAITVQEVASDMYFLSLRMQIFIEIIVRGSPKDPTPPGSLQGDALPGLPSPVLPLNGAA